MKAASVLGLSVLLIAVFALAGCAGKEPAGCTGTCHVAMASATFEPKEIRIQKGATVHWMFKENTNQTGNPHDVVSEDGSFGSTGLLVQGGTAYQYTFNTAGTFNYRCTQHSSGSAWPYTGMIGKVIVVA